MMRQLGINMTVRVQTYELTKRLLANLEKHSAMVDEAKKTYLIEARKTLEKKLAQLQEGKLTNVTVHLRVPEDYSHVYRTALGMVGVHTGDEIEIGADEYRKLMEDEWEWTSQFVTANSAYSASVREFAASKGLADL